MSCGIIRFTRNNKLILTLLLIENKLDKSQEKGDGVGGCMGKVDGGKVIYAICLT